MIDQDLIEPRLRRYLDERSAERPSAGLEDRILHTVRDEPRHRPAFSWPAQAAAAAAIAALAIGLAAGVAYLRSHGTAGEGPAPPARTPALSIGTQGGGDWMVVRGIDYGTPTRLPRAATNVLYHTTDGGHTWQDRLHFDGNYEGMSWAANGRIGTVWTFDQTRPCGITASSCTLPPSGLLTVYSTSDSGLHWTARSPQAFGDFALTYFRGSDGWVVSRQDHAQGQTPTVPQLFRTTDAALTWTKIADMPDLNGMQLSGGMWGTTYGVGETNLEFADAQHGWLATGLEETSAGSGLLETTDSGKTWHSVNVQTPAAMSGQQLVLGYPILLGGDQALLPAFFGHRTDPNNFSVSHHYLYTSTDGGASWSHPVALNANGVEPTGDEWQNFYLDANHWWFTAINQRAAGEPVPQAGPAVARTTDGGKTWLVFQDKNAPTILQLSFTDANNGWALAVTGPNNTNILLRTTDGGAHWHQVQIP